MSMIRGLLVSLLVAALALVTEFAAVPPAQAAAATAPVAAAVGGPSTEVAAGDLTLDEPPVEPPADEPPLVTEPGQVRISAVAMVGETVAAVLEGWTEGTVFQVQWLLDGAPLPGATDIALTIPVSAVDGSLSVQVTGTMPGASPVSVVSDAVQVAPRPLTATTPSITGTAAVGGWLTARVSGWSPDAALTYQWYADGSAITGATGYRFKLTSAQAAKTIAVRVTGSLTGSTTEQRTSAATARVVTPGRVSISGKAATGQTLTARPTSWATGTRLRYQWFADGTPISGATARTLRLTSRHSGRAITVRVVATRTGWATVERTSAASQRVMRWSRPTITGTVSAGFTLRARTGTWTSGTSFRYQWYANGSAVRGATHATFRLTSSYAGDRISVRVTGRKSGHPTVAATSVRTARVARSARPTISGHRYVGALLTAKTGTWTSGTRLRYQWYADGRAIRGATARTYRLSSAREEQRITVTVTGRRSGYATVARTSAQTPKIARVGRPSVSGTPRVTRQLVARTGTWTQHTTFRYQWYVDGKAVRGATARTFTLRPAHVGATVRVRVTGSRSGYSTYSRTSTATSRVTYPNRTAPATRTTCPRWAPIKGNADSMIYHLRGQRFYNVTHPEECFRTEAAARAAGYRKAKV